MNAATSLAQLRDKVAAFAARLDDTAQVQEAHEHYGPAELLYDLADEVRALLASDVEPDPRFEATS